MDHGNHPPPRDWLKVAGGKKKTKPVKKGGKSGR